MKYETCIRQEADMRQISACKEAISASEGVLEHLSDTFRLAGNTVRLKILFLLRQEGRLCVCDLSDILSMKIPAISQHLRKLKDKGLVRSIRSGQVIYYELSESFRRFFNPFYTMIRAEQNEMALPE